MDGDGLSEIWLVLMAVLLARRSAVSGVRHGQQMSPPGSGQTLIICANYLVFYGLSPPHPEMTFGFLSSILRGYNGSL